MFHRDSKDAVNRLQDFKDNKLLTARGTLGNVRLSELNKEKNRQAVSLLSSSFLHFSFFAGAQEPYCYPHHLIFTKPIFPAASYGLHLYLSILPLDCRLGEGLMKRNECCSQLNLDSYSSFLCFYKQGSTGKRGTTE